MAKYAKQTMICEHSCPYCGNIGNTWWKNGGYDKGEDEARFHCDDCDMDYFIQYQSNSWNEDEEYYEKIEDVTDRHRKSLLED